MRKVIFGQPVTATDVERLPADDRAVAFVRLCGSLIGAALADRAGSFTLPAISERINVPDGGVDASYTTSVGSEIAEAGGLVGPGTTDYQFKYRDPATAARGMLVSRIVERLREELRRSPPEADRYVLMINLDLSREQRRRLREALVETHPPLANKTVVIWGAAELAQALNATPRLRHVFFSESGLCTLDTAKSELRAAYDKVGWPDFVGREDERRAIESFAGDPDSRYLEIVGARYSGRTRLVIEALEKRGASVVWASEPEAATLDVFRELDSDALQSILVVDGCMPAVLRDMRDRALSRERLKTIGISTGGEREASGIERGRIVVDRLPHGDAARLVRNVLRHVAPLQESWVIEAAGGVPGLVLHIAALLRDGAVSPSDPGGVERRLGDLLHDQYTRGLSPEAQKALAAASLLSAVGVEGGVRQEIDAVSGALGIAPGTFALAHGELEDRGLVRRRGRFAEVVPPRLAEEVASRALADPERTVAELRLRLTDSAFMRFLERLRSLPGDTSRRTIANILGAGGWFQDLDSLERGARRFEALVPAAPREALRCLEGLLGPLSAAELFARVTGDVRRSVVFALDELSLGSQTFCGAARLLLALAEAENEEEYGNNARGTFVSLFHWNHPEVSASLRVRLEALQDGAASGSAARRAVVAKACGTAFSEHGFVMLHHAKGPAVPEGPARPGTWEEVRRYGEGVLTLLDRLTADPCSPVRDKAVTSLEEVVGAFVRLSLLPDGFHVLGSKAFDILERVGREAESARRRSHIVSRLELIADTLRKEAETNRRESVAVALGRAEALLEDLTKRTLKDRLWHWVGPRTWARWVDPQGEERTVSAIQALAADLAADPQALREQLPWLTSEDAEHRAPLLNEIGRLDRGERLIRLLLDEPGDQFWAQAVAAYFQGWHEAEPDQAGRALDDLIALRADLSAGTLAATSYLPISHETVRRVRQIAEHRRIPRPELARQIAFGLAWDRLSAADAEALIGSIDDQTAETRSALLHGIWLRLARGAELSAGLEELGWSFLESTLPADEGRARDSGWDLLAAKLGERDSKRLLALFARLMQESVSAGRRRFQVSNDLALTWRTLLRNERQGVLEALLEISLTPDPPYWLDWTLSKELRPDEDMPTLLAFVERSGIEAARGVAEMVDAGNDGFWRLARELLVRWGQDQRLGASLASRVRSGAWSGSAVDLISERMQFAQDLTSHPDAKVVRWAQAVLADLEEWRKSAAREDREDWIWDQPVSQAEIEGLLEQKDAPERLWAIGRLLKDAPESRVQELLTPEDILDALPKLGHLDERTRRKWEAWARHWSSGD